MGITASDRSYARINTDSKYIIIIITLTTLIANSLPQPNNKNENNNEKTTLPTMDAPRADRRVRITHKKNRITH